MRKYPPHGIAAQTGLGKVKPTGCAAKVQYIRTGEHIDCLKQQTHVARNVNGIRHVRQRIAALLRTHIQPCKIGVGSLPQIDIAELSHKILNINLHGWVGRRLRVVRQCVQGHHTPSLRTM